MSALGTPDLSYTPPVGPQIMELIMGEEGEFAVRFEVDPSEWEVWQGTLRDLIQFKVMGAVKAWVGGTLTTLRWPG